MSKYHKGDKFIVEIKEVIESDNGTLYRSNFKTLTFDDNGLDKLQKCETELSWDECYNRGLNDAWELAKKLYAMKIDDIQAVFGGLETELEVMKYYTSQEVLAKLEAYEKDQNEIKVGDVVTIFPRSGGQYDAIVVLTKSQGYIDAIYSDGVTTNNVPPELYKKTGKHIDIQSVLSQIAE